MTLPKISNDEAELVFDRLLSIVLEDTGETAREHLAAGHAVYYGDDAYPDFVIKKYPDGREELVDFDKDGNEFTIRSL
jgi:hypothetical protein